MTQSALSNHKWTRSYIASFYFRILISESRVSDSSSLGKVGVAPGLWSCLTLSLETIPRKVVQSRDYSVMGDGAICPTRFSVFRRILTVKMKYELLSHSISHSISLPGCCRYLKSRCYFCESQISFLISHLAPVYVTHLIDRQIGFC